MTKLGAPLGRGKRNDDRAALPARRLDVGWWLARRHAWHGARRQSPPNGYTLLLVPTSHVINPSIYAKLPYDTEKDFRADHDGRCGRDTDG